MAGNVVQSRFNDSLGVTSLALAFSVNNTAGNTIAVFGADGSGTGGSESCADSANGTYGAAGVTVNDTNDNNTGFGFSKSSIAAGANTVTLTSASGTINMGICIVEMSGVTARDGAAGQAQAGVATTANAITSGNGTNAATAFMVGFCWAVSSTLIAAAGTGFTSTAAGNVAVSGWTNLGGGSAGTRLEWKASVAPGNNAATFTGSASNDWVTMMMMFDESSGVVAPSLMGGMRMVMP